jgi:hypothetical protein
MNIDSDDEDWHYIPFWKSKSRNSYPCAILLTVHDERYDIDTETIVPIQERIKLHHRTYVGDFMHHAVYLTRGYRSRYTPHILLGEDYKTYSQVLRSDLRNLSTWTGFYERRKTFNRLLGDTPVENHKFVYKSTNEVEKLNAIRSSTVQQVRDQVLQEGEYFLKRTDYNTLTRPLYTTEPDEFGNIVPAYRQYTSEAWCGIKNTKSK